MNTDTWNGTSGDDIINAPFDYAASTPSPTINALDYIDAAAGIDTLNIEGNQSIVGTFKNIENVFFKGIDAASRR